MPGREQSQGLESIIDHPALTDPKTGLANRLHFELVYSYMFSAGNRGLTFTVMLLSVGGPDALSESELESVGHKIRKTTRDSDLVAHIGRGRYAVLLVGTNLPGARIAADRIEMALSEVSTKALSFGLAAYAEDMKDAAALLRSADEALEAAEEAGGGLEFGQGS